MHFKVKARVLLELGAELISSDEIAIYELVKNGVDAGSKKLEIRINVALSFTGYKTMQARLKQKCGHALSPEFVDEQLIPLLLPTVDANVSSEFRERMLASPPKSHLDTARTFYCEYSFIEVEDWGHGMTVEQVDERFLTIGTSHRAKNVEDSNGDPLGEKGIGRLSCMRLGRKLTLRTVRKEQPRYAVLEVDWARLYGDLDLTLEQFAVAAKKGETKEKPDEKGTLVRVEDLQSDWTPDAVDALVVRELAKLQNPFDRKLARLVLTLKYNGGKVGLQTAMDTRWMSEWHGYFKADFNEREVQGESQMCLSGQVKYRPPPTGSKDSIAIDEADVFVTLEGLASFAADKAQPLIKGGTEGAGERYVGLDTLGPFSVEAYWFNRQRKRLELDNHEEKEAFSTWMTKWGGGLLVYRDGYRVYPYANPEDDWLELDQVALRKRSYKLNRGQFVGYVAITRKGNPALVDQTNRQGIVDSPEKRRLVFILQKLIWEELGALIAKHERKATKVALSSVTEISKIIDERSKEAKKQITAIELQAPEQAEKIHKLRAYIDEIEAGWQKAKDTIKRQEKSTEVYVHLAGVGMLTEFIVHEMQRTTRNTLAQLTAGSRKKDPALEPLFQQLKSLEKRLRILNPTSIPGRQRRSVVNVSTVLSTLLDAHTAQFERHDVQPDATLKGFESFVVEGYVYQIFENLISNSIYWVGNRRAYLSQAPEGPTPYQGGITVDVDAGARTVYFSDNGPGIEPSDSRKIFEPFFSKKPDQGRGIGLHIVRRLCDESDIQISLLPVSEQGTHPGFKLVFPNSKVEK
ncbi:hypothetical protein A9R05_15610 [Burkholderia sp. KK1]|nr:hypothetical protein A9R05_15610 [Burkholderia sp. KK1]